MSEPLKHRVIKEADLRELAKQIATSLPTGANLYLSGELGAGKTTFCRVLLDHLGSKKPATSPTFALVNYHTLGDGRPAWHVDLYRLSTPDDVSSLGLLEALADHETTVVVEWPERAAPILPRPTRHLHFSHHTPLTRVVSAL